ncbi:hypothetical protein PhCBS80983_g05396 [Powellomyces hirtus]|uniref:Uncharacterized protein n=1 Tax=Powellomyces hirtus TaxID=109895 RepID=A0A507DUA9_9FUNG|nr:hypothetical protein PhCBS80983_g05396 [Powellomyces hirtus]
MPSLLSTSSSKSTTGMKGIFALFGKSSSTQPPKGKKSDPAATAEDSVDFLRRHSASTLVEEPTVEETTKAKKSTDPYTIFIETVENDIASMQKVKTFRVMRWKVPAGVDVKKAMKGCKRNSPSNASFDIETVGTLTYISARWA